MPPGLPPEVAQYLQRHHVMTLATHGALGPWAAAVFYANDGPALFFLSSPTTRHCRNLAQDARCAATIQDDTAQWSEIRGVQLEGQARELGGDEARRARDRYAEKFPVVARLSGAPAAIAEAMSKVRWYQVDTERLYFIDNSRGFGHRDRFDLARS